MKKLLSLFVPILIIISVLPCAYATGNGFNDVHESDWYYQTVMNMVNSGYVNGYGDGSFKPDQAISRIEFTKIAYEALPMGRKVNEISDEEKSKFKEENKKYWGCDIILEATERGLGWFGDKPSDWDLPITREEMASVAFDASVTTSIDVGLAYYIDVLTAFGDYGDCLASNYLTSITYMCSTGIFGGVNDNKDFAPKDTATRAEACTTINRLIDKSLRYDPFSYSDKYTDAPFLTTYITDCLDNNNKTYDEAAVDYSYLPSTAKGVNYTDAIYGGMSEQEAVECKEVVDRFLANYIRPNMSEALKAGIAAEYVMANCSYSMEAQSFYNAWGALVGKQASCYGYSYAYKLLCDAMDIGCVVVPADDDCGNPNHQWNEVRIDGYWYIIDVQACDLARDFSIQYGDNFYFGEGDPNFLVSDDTYYQSTLISGGCTWDKTQYPVCNHDYFEE